MDYTIDVEAPAYSSDDFQKVLFMALLWLDKGHGKTKEFAVLRENYNHAIQAKYKKVTAANG